MTNGLPDIGDVEGVRCVVVDDELTLRASMSVSGRSLVKSRPTGPLPKSLLSCRGRSANATRFASSRISTISRPPGGCTRASEVARLWGAATRPHLRGHGAYRSVLRERLTVARAHGATLGLVKGRVETSGPILRRVGFEPYGQERLFDLAL